MTPLKIKVKLLEAGLTQAEIARRLGTTRQAVNHVLAGRSQSPRIRAAIAEALGLPVDRIWPTRRRPPRNQPKA